MQTLWEPLKRSKLGKPQTQKLGQFYNDITICFIFFIPFSLVLWIIFNTLHSSIPNLSIDYPMVSQFLLERSRNLWLKYASCLTSQHCSGVPITCLFSDALNDTISLIFKKPKTRTKKNLRGTAVLLDCYILPNTINIGFKFIAFGKAQRYLLLFLLLLLLLLVWGF